MRRLLFLPLLALPLLLLSCDGPAPTEPEPEQVADPLFKPTPIPGYGTATNCIWDTDRHYCGAVTGNSYVVISWCPAITRGTVTVQACLSKATGNWAFGSVCENKQGRWKTVYKEQLTADPINCAVTMTFAPGLTDQFGFRFLYRGQGSGYENTTYTEMSGGTGHPLDFDGAVPPS